MDNDQLSKEEAAKLLQELRVEHDYDTSTDDQDEP